MLYPLSYGSGTSTDRSASHPLLEMMLHPTPGAINDLVVVRGYLRESNAALAGRRRARCLARSGGRFVGAEVVDGNRIARIV
jgi:hypothetical protein